ncbi:MAG: hypothetical protein QM602_05560, partial [Microbacterium sp.]
MTDAAPVRSLVLWIPDWPVVALARGSALANGSPLARGPSQTDRGSALAGDPGSPHASAPTRAPHDHDELVAVVEANVVTACSAAARAEGVRRGLRRRDAQARCPRLRVVAAD